MRLVRCNNCVAQVTNLSIQTHDVNARNHSISYRVVPQLERTERRHFAVAPEFEVSDFAQMNTGVMLMNLANLKETLPNFRRFIREHLESLPEEAWDQGAYRRYI